MHILRCLLICLILIIIQIIPASAQETSSDFLTPQQISGGEFYTSDKNRLAMALVQNILFDPYQRDVFAEKENDFHILVDKVKKQELKYEAVDFPGSPIGLKSCFNCSENRLALLRAYAEFLVEKRNAPNICYACDVFSPIVDPKKLFDLSLTQENKTEFIRVLDEIQNSYRKNWKNLRLDKQSNAAAMLEEMAPYLPPAREKKAKLFAYEIRKYICLNYGCREEYIRNQLQATALELKQHFPFENLVWAFEFTVDRWAMHPEKINVYAHKGKPLSAIQQSELKDILNYIYSYRDNEEASQQMDAALRSRTLPLKKTTWNELYGFRKNPPDSPQNEAEARMLGAKIDKLKEMVSKDLGALITVY